MEEQQTSNLCVARSNRAGRITRKPAPRAEHPARARRARPGDGNRNGDAARRGSLVLSRVQPGTPGTLYPDYSNDSLIV